MRAWFTATAVLALATAGVAQQPAQQQQSRQQQQPSAKPPIDRSILHVQVILDKLGFGPGILDGREGQSLTAALKGYQTAAGLDVTGEMDQHTLRSLHRYRAIRPTKTIALTPAMLSGPFVNPIPDDYNLAAKLPTLAYRSPLEKLAEMFHTTPQVLVELNSRETPLKAGQQVVFPNALPGSRNYPAELPEGWRHTLSQLNVDANQRQGERIVVDESDGVLRVYDKADRLIGQFSATMGSEKFPLPLGTWTMKGPAYNPDWNFDPDLIAGTKPGAKEAVLPPGPNNPVGVVWLDLSKEHYGIHGTSEPQNIGRSESNGCIRLTNWDAARLAMMIKSGATVLFQA
jgi:lipoprotein-anchoring transpeptidase ErfK/SrfK